MSGERAACEPAVHPPTGAEGDSVSCVTQEEGPVNWVPYAKDWFPDEWKLQKDFANPPDESTWRPGVGWIPNAWVDIGDNQEAKSCWRIRDDSSAEREWTIHSDYLPKKWVRADASQWTPHSDYLPLHWTTKSPESPGPKLYDWHPNCGWLPPKWRQGVATDRQVVSWVASLSDGVGERPKAGPRKTTLYEWRPDTGFNVRAGAKRDALPHSRSDEEWSPGLGWIPADWPEMKVFAIPVYDENYLPINTRVATWANTPYQHVAMDLCNEAAQVDRAKNGLLGPVCPLLPRCKKSAPARGEREGSALPAIRARRKREAQPDGRIFYRPEHRRPVGAEVVPPDFLKEDCDKECRAVYKGTNIAPGQLASLFEHMQELTTQRLRDWCLLDCRDREEISLTKYSPEARRAGCKKKCEAKAAGSAGYGFMTSFRHDMRRLERKRQCLRTCAKRMNQDLLRRKPRSLSEQDEPTSTLVMKDLIRPEPHAQGNLSDWMSTALADKVTMRSSNPLKGEVETLLDDAGSVRRSATGDAPSDQDYAIDPHFKHGPKTGGGYRLSADVQYLPSAPEQPLATVPQLQRGGVAASSNLSSLLTNISALIGVATLNTTDLKGGTPQLGQLRH